MIRNPVRMTLLPVLITVIAVGLGLRTFDIVQRMLDGQPLEAVRPVMADENVPRPDELPLPDDQASPEAGADPGEGEAAAVPEESDPDSVPLFRLDEDELNATELGLLQSLGERREELERRSAELDQREALILAAERRVEAKIETLSETRREIETLLGELTEQQEKQIESLVKIYESMKAKDAAVIFNTLEMPVLLNVVQRMRANNAAGVLSEMQPDRAREITHELARNRQLEGDRLQ